MGKGRDGWEGEGRIGRGGKGRERWAGEGKGKEEAEGGEGVGKGQEGLDFDICSGPQELVTPLYGD